MKIRFLLCIILLSACGRNETEQVKLTPYETKNRATIVAAGLSQEVENCKEEGEKLVESGKYIDHPASFGPETECLLRMVERYRQKPTHKEVCEAVGGRIFEDAARCSKPGV